MYPRLDSLKSKNLFQLKFLISRLITFVQLWITSFTLRWVISREPCLTLSRVIICQKSIEHPENLITVRRSSPSIKNASNFLISSSTPPSTNHGEITYPKLHHPSMYFHLNVLICGYDFCLQISSYNGFTAGWDFSPWNSLPYLKPNSYIVFTV